MFGMNMLVALGVALASAAAQAQPAQTAEGAQRFLAAVARKGGVSLSLTNARQQVNLIPGTATRTAVRDGKVLSTENIEKAFQPFPVLELDSRTADGKIDPCVTRIARLSVSEPLTEKLDLTQKVGGMLFADQIDVTLVRTYTPAPTMTGPHWIDWRNVKLRRHGNTPQPPQVPQFAVDFPANGYAGMLAFNPDDPELAARIETAAKFLRTTCDDTAATGF